MPAEPLQGSAQRGEQIYRSKGNCAQCHALHGRGGTLGPELTDVG
jgi:mono/diheme cytochrome c family protein